GVGGGRGGAVEEGADAGAEEGLVGGGRRGDGEQQQGGRHGVRSVCGWRRAVSPQAALATRPAAKRPLYHLSSRGRLGRSRGASGWTIGRPRMRTSSRSMARTAGGTDGSPVVTSTVEDRARRF